MARSQAPDPDPNGGFTLVELLITMAIIGVLTAIAVPTFLSQRAKAQDAAAKADASVVGKEVATYFADSATAPSLTISGGQYVVAGRGVAVASPNVRFGTIANPPASTTTADTTGWTATAWCVNILNFAGSQKYVRYSAQAGLELGSCTSATSP